MPSPMNMVSHIDINFMYLLLDIHLLCEEFLYLKNEIVISVGLFLVV